MLALEVLTGCSDRLERDAQSELDNPRTVILAAHHPKAVRVLEVQAARAILTAIPELHVVEGVKELYIERRSDSA